MINLFVAGPSSFVDRIISESEHLNIIRIVGNQTDAAATVDAVERYGNECDAILLGFEETYNEDLVKIMVRYAVRFTPFVVVDDLYAGLKKWMRYKTQAVENRNELAQIINFFEDSNMFNNANKRDDVYGLGNKEHESESESDIDYRVDLAKERTRTGAVGVRNKVISMFSFKGGVGKTTLTTAIAQSVVATTDLRVCIIDLDTSRDYGDIVKYLGYMGSEKKKIVHTAVSWANFPYNQKNSQDVVENHLLRVRKNLFVLPGMKSMTDTSELNAKLMHDIIDVLKKHFDLVLLDLGNYLTDIAIACMEMSDYVFMINTLSITEIDSLKEFLDNTIPYVKIQKSQVQVIFNKVLPNSKFTINEVAGFIGYQAITGVPADPEADRMISFEGKVPYYGGQDLPFTKALEPILVYIFPREIYAKKENGSKKLNLFGWLKKKS